MKLNRFGVVSALVVAAAAVGCSSDTPKSGQNGENGSISFKLTTSDGKVDFSSAHYYLTTQASPPVAVLDDDIPVPRPESTLSLGIQRVAYGDYGLRFHADGTYHNPNGTNQPVSCDSPVSNFSLSSPATVTLPTITLTCTAVSGQTNNTGNVEANVDVRVVENTEENVIETFSYGPRSVLGYLDSGTCKFPDVALKIKHDDATISYTWSDNGGGGTFLANANTTDGTYTCGSGGTKVLTLTGVKGSTTSTKQFTVVCDDAPCGFACGNGIVEGSEQCDAVTLPTTRCSAGCIVTPSCGDGVVDGPNGVCSGGKPNAACTEACDPLGDSNCTSTCTIIPPVTCGNGTVGAGEDCEPPGTATCDTTCHRIPVCGDGFIDLGTTPPEQCDDGATGPLPNNSNTLANACRTDCTVAHCGDTVVDAGEQCDPPATGTCSATCQTVTVTPPTQFETCTTCISGDADTNDIQQFFCTSATCQTVEACIINSGCYFPNPTDCYCGIGANLDTCLQPSAAVPGGPCADLYRTATGNLVTGTGQIDNAATLDASTLTTNAAGQAQAVVANVADPSAVCFGACGFP